MASISENVSNNLALVQKAAFGVGLVSLASSLALYTFHGKK